MGGDMPKVLTRVNDKPLFRHVAEFWKPFVQEFVFVVGHKKAEVTRAISESMEEVAPFRIVEQYEQKGIAHAILQTEPVIKDNFVVALGDCLNYGAFRCAEFPPEPLAYGVRVIDSLDDIRKNAYVEAKDGYITYLSEKPEAYSGIGTYFFDRRIFDYIRKTQPSQLRNETEITDVMHNVVKDKGAIRVIPFSGQFINVTYPADVVKATAVHNMNLVTARR
jgi:glucose-1-phosphate thymidylyltransferase